MKVDQLVVYLNGRSAGSLHLGPRDRLSFVYRDDYRADPNATPLSCALPLTVAEHPDSYVRPYLWGLLPDNERVLERWARQFHVSARKPLELLAAVGRDLPGAVEMLAPGDQPVMDSADVNWMSEEDVAAELRRVREDEAAWLPARGPGRWSLAGSHAKVALLYHEGHWGRPGGAMPTNRILKPAIAEFPGHDVNEHLCLVAARKCGLSVVPSSVVSFGNERAVVVSRFDRRVRDDGTVERIHQEDVCQALAINPANKYESEGGPSAARIAALLSQEIGGPEGRNAVWSFYDALVFNWTIAGPDAHAKNYSLLHLGRSVRLAPLYDIGSALPYPDYYGPKVKLAMRVGGHYRVGAISAKTWAREAQELGLNGDEALEHARRLASEVPDAFADARRELGATGTATAFADRLVDAVASHSATCMNRLR